MFEKIKNISNYKYISILAVFFIVLIIFLNVKPFGPYSFRKAKVIDVRYSYSTNDVISLFNKLGENGRGSYKLFYLFDYIFGLVYFLLFVLIILNNYYKKLKMVKLTKVFLIIALFAVLFDYIENTLVLIMLSKYPANISSLVSIAKPVTLLKFLFNYSSLLIIIAGVILRFTRRNKAA